jgi:hypothetical protein
MEKPTPTRYTRLAATVPTVSRPSLHPVDSDGDPNHSAGVSKKPQHKIKETAAPYAAKKPVQQPVAPASPADQPPQIRYATPEQARKAAGEVFKVHEELFRKLAQ